MTYQLPITDQIYDIGFKAGYDGKKLDRGVADSYGAYSSSYIEGYYNGKDLATKERG